MIGPRSAASVVRDPADARDLRSVIAAALAAKPVDEHSLRLGVWTWVGAERDAGTPPGRVIMELDELVEAARIVAMTSKQALKRSVILWCVEAYFGHLGGDVCGDEVVAPSPVPATAEAPRV